MKKTTVNSKILTILICLLTLLTSAAKAQVGFDAVSIEAYIKDHKQQRSLLLVRSTLEASNKLLHELQRRCQHWIQGHQQGTG